MIGFFEFTVWLRHYQFARILGGQTPMVSTGFTWTSSSKESVSYQQTGCPKRLFPKGFEPPSNFSPANSIESPKFRQLIAFPAALSPQFKIETKCRSSEPLLHLKPSSNHSGKTRIWGFANNRLE